MRVKESMVVRHKSMRRKVAFPFGAPVIVGEHVRIGMLKLLQIRLDLGQKSLGRGAVSILFKQSSILRHLLVPGILVYRPRELKLQNSAISSLTRTRTSG